nr:hypothetical protein [Tanacetum cinerariifolium]
MDRNKVRPPAIVANTKFLNSLQPEWSKYVTMTRQKHMLKTKEYDALFDHLSQLELHVNASKAKKATRSHDPLALVANPNVHSLNSHAREIQGDAQEDKLTIAMMVWARAITQRYSTPTNNCLRSSSNTMNQVVVRDGRVDIQSKNVGYSIKEYDYNVERNPRTKSTLRKTNVQCYNCNEKCHYVRKCPKPIVSDAKYFREQMLLVLKDEARAHLDNEENDFMLDNAYRDNTLWELNAAVIMMARILPTYDKSDAKPTYDAEFIYEILENDFKRAKAQYINLDLKMQHQKEKTACDVSWRSKMAKLNGENVSLNIQIKSLVQENERIKHEFQNLFNAIKATRVQHQQEINELIENVNQKTYVYDDVCAKNQDLLMTNSELKAKLKLAKKGKNVRTKFKKSATLEKLICVTPFNKNKDLKAKIVSKVEVKTGKSKPVTLCSTPKNEQGVASTSSVSRSESKDTNSKKRVLMNTKSKSTSMDIKKFQSSFTLVSNKNDTMNSNVFESKVNVLKAKVLNVVHDGLNLVCVSYGKDVFLIAHDKCVAHYALSLNSRVKRALFTSHVAAKSIKLGATHVVAKSRFSVATPPKATNKVSHASSLTLESRQSRTLNTYMKNKIVTSRKWQKSFEHQSSYNWSPKSSTA